MYWEYEFPGMILSVFVRSSLLARHTPHRFSQGADFIFSAGIMYVSKVAGPGQQALAGGVFNMVTRSSSALPPQARY